MNPFLKFYAYLTYRKAVSMADKTHRENRYRYFVLPNARGKVDLVVTDRHNFRRLRMKHYIDSSVNMKDVLWRCFYYTPTANEGNPIDDRTKAVKLSQFFSWYENRRLMDKAARRRRKHSKSR